MPILSEPRVQLGIDRLLAGAEALPGSRWGLVTNYTGVTSDLVPSSVALTRAEAPLVALFAPEHGLAGTAQPGESENDDVDRASGLPVVDTYRRSGAQLRALLEEWDLDLLVVDIQDIGVRFYTYVWTMYDCMVAAAECGVDVVVLDRPNPLGGELCGGPGIEPGFESFVGRVGVPIRHGLTIGELARLAADWARRAGNPVPEPRVVAMAGWSRSMQWWDTGLDWVLPSPSIPTPETALVYPGTCLLEGTNACEGRGTARPFQMVGAPWLAGDLRAAMTESCGDVVHVREATFRPVAGTFAGQLIRGVDLYPVDPAFYPALEVGVVLLARLGELSGGELAWREPVWEIPGERRRPHFIDLLWGSASLREHLDRGDLAGALDLARSNRDFLDRVEGLLLYPRGGSEPVSAPLRPEQPLLERRR